MESHAMPYQTSGGVRWRAWAAVLAASAVAALLVAHTLMGARVSGDRHAPVRVLAETESSTGEISGGGKDRFPWSNAMLQWQRTGFHFQPEKHYMNAPMYYRGWYHFFYQYNPRAPTQVPPRLARPSRAIGGANPSPPAAPIPSLLPLRCRRGTAPSRARAFDGGGGGLLLLPGL